MLYLWLYLAILVAVQEIFETLCQCAALNPDTDGESQSAHSVLPSLVRLHSAWEPCVITASRVCQLYVTCHFHLVAHVHANDSSSEHEFVADDSEEGDFFYNDEEVLNGVGAADRAALLNRYDAMLGDSEQPELEEVHLTFVVPDCDKSSAMAPGSSIPAGPAQNKACSLTAVLACGVSPDSVTSAL